MEIADDDRRAVVSQLSLILGEDLESDDHGAKSVCCATKYGPYQWAALVLAVERRFGLRFGTRQLRARSITTIDGIVRLVLRHLGDKERGLRPAPRRPGSSVGPSVPPKTRDQPRQNLTGPQRCNAS